MNSSKTKVFNYADIFFSYIHEGDTICTNRAFSHIMICVISGNMTINENGKEIKVYPNECVFIRRDHRVRFTKKPSKTDNFVGITLLFSHKFLREYFQQLDHTVIPATTKPLSSSIVKLPQTPDFNTIFTSLIPYFDIAEKPTDEFIDQKLREGISLLLKLDNRFYPTFFDFIEPWKIDILNFLNENYMDDLTITEIASYTGRSLATFKRDFRKISELSPQKWLIQKRLQTAFNLLKSGNKKVLEVCYEVGFKDRSHFSKAFKNYYGFPPSSGL